MKAIYAAALLSLSLCSTAQSWQWGKRGGSSNTLTQNGGSRKEEAFGMVSDNLHNVYVVSEVGMINLDIDGHPKTTFSDPTTLADIAFTSFGCDGAYRWSKIIGGGNREKMNPLGIDSQGNIYVSGRFGDCGAPGDYPQQIENDTVLSQDSEHCSLVFIAKYNSDGEMLWFRRPQPPVDEITAFSYTTTYGARTDAAGNTYMLMLVPPGTYGNGAFTNTIPNAWYIFKYDTNGNFVNATYLDMQLQGLAQLTSQFYYNEHNHHYYITGSRMGNDAMFNGQPTVNGFFFASFDENGAFLWKREDTSASDGYMFSFDMKFDAEDNIYMAGTMKNGDDSFLGYSTNFSVIGLYSAVFLLKLNPIADTILWGSSANQNALNYGGLAFNGNEIGLTGSCTSLYSPYVWGNQSMTVTSFSNSGTRALLAKFDKATGSCTSLAVLTAADGSSNCGETIVAQNPGEYVIGGFFTAQQTVNTTTLASNGGNSDFFIAKNGPEACSPLGAGLFEKQKMRIWPNPAHHILNLDNMERVTYTLYNVLGQALSKGTLEVNGGIDTSGLAKGVYMLSVDGTAFRFVKE